MSDQGNGKERRRPGRCPICGRETVHAYRPFCSRRCADIDLGRWLSGSYAIPGRSAEEEGEAPRGGGGEEPPLQ